MMESSRVSLLTLLSGPVDSSSVSSPENGTQVHGLHSNVGGYNDESISTTQLEGRANRNGAAAGVLLVIVLSK